MSTGEVTFMLCGDVMLGRGIDQVMAHPSSPALYEPYVRSALDYVALAEEASGPIPRKVAPSYVWGDALDELTFRKPDLRIINLETAVARSDQPEPKGINYRMSPRNVSCLTAAGIDCCILANNHVLDWGRAGLLETRQSLDRAGIATAGAGGDLAAAEAPAIFKVSGEGRVLVYAAAHGSSGVPSDWTAGEERPGVSLVDDLSAYGADRVAERVARDRRAGDIVVFSIHWGGNWGYPVSGAQRAFAHRLIDSGQVDVIHGHSSHHFKALEVYRNKLVLYGCGDFINDYEGIGGRESFRSDLVLMYLPALSPADGGLSSLDLVPFRIRKFRLERPDSNDAEWIRQTLGRECRTFEGRVATKSDGTLSIEVSAAPDRFRSPGR